jgi:hypothetical protein
MEKLGSYPACPDSRKKPDLRAIRVSDRSTQGGLVGARDSEEDGGTCSGRRVLLAPQADALLIIIFLVSGQKTRISSPGYALYVG